MVIGVIKRTVVTLSNIEDTIAVKKHNVLINGQILPLVSYDKINNLLGKLTLHNDIFKCLLDIWKLFL